MRTIHVLLLNLLIGLNAFILFFLLFESYIVVPPALQVFGRTHPLFLHFPIVLLLLAWVIECFGGQLGLAEGYIERLGYVLLFASAVSAAVTVVAGLLLGSEGGYVGSGFLWHKWLGVVLGFLTACLLWCRRLVRKRSHHRFFLVGLNVSVVVLLVLGHLGASLTHGEDYLFEPLRLDRPKSVDMETAVVYQDLVYPIFRTKCLNCHNGRKAKGGLVLADTASIMQGGDSGPALVRGSVANSLVIERLLLDIDDEHRMPPKGKPQLTPTELALIHAWIAGGADFHIPLASLPPTDTIRKLAAALYDLTETRYDFRAADPEIIEQLNNPYRAVKPVSHASPALAVSFYGAGHFSGQSLQELRPVSEQIVSLTLNGMPLSVSDRDVLATFSNLRELRLNSTPVDDTWSEALANLPQLQVLSLSSTALTEVGLATVLTAPVLRAVYVWNTAVNLVAMRELQLRHKGVRIEHGYVDDGSTILPLNEPVLKPASTFFRDNFQLELTHPVSGVEIRYTLDGTEPDSVKAAIYKMPLAIEKSTTVRAKGYKAGWLPSSEISRVFHRSGYSPSRLFLLTSPDPKYKGRGAYTLYDLESAGRNHADGKWLGFHGRSMTASMHFDAAIQVDTIGVSVKQDYPSHIYPPEWIEVWGGPDSSTAQLLIRFQPGLHTPGEASPSRVVAVPARGVDLRYLSIIVTPFVPIPTGYPASGHPAWIFIDEILIY